MICLNSKISWNKSFFNLHDSSLGRHVTDTSRKNSEIQASFMTKPCKNPFEVKICMKISFQLL